MSRACFGCQIKRGQWKTDTEEVVLHFCSRVVMHSISVTNYRFAHRLKTSFFERSVTVFMFEHSLRGLMQSEIMLTSCFVDSRGQEPKVHVMCEQLRGSLELICD